MDCIWIGLESSLEWQIGLKERSPPKNNVYFWTLLKLAPPPPHFGHFIPLFLDVKKQRIAHMTEKSTDGNDDG